MLVERFFRSKDLRYIKWNYESLYVNGTWFKGMNYVKASGQFRFTLSDSF
jgi:hypothetical protein